MAENRWSHGDPNDPLGWHLDELRYEAQCADPLSPEWFDSFVLVSRRYVKDLVGRAIQAANRPIWDSITNMEEHMSATDDALAEADAITNEIAQDLDDLAAQLKGKDQAIADKIRAHSDKLRGVANKYPEVESTEPPADGEPVNSGDPQTFPVAGADPLPVTHFPDESDSGADQAPDTSSDVPAPAGQDAGDASSSESGNASQ